MNFRVLTNLLIIVTLIAGVGCGGKRQSAEVFDLRSLAAENQKWQMREARPYSMDELEKHWREAFNVSSTLPASTSSLPQKSRSELTVVIDPGHGNPGNPGAAGPSGILEKDVVLDISYRLKSLLERDGFKVIMTRTGGETLLGNPERAEVANRNKADLFVRVHADSDKNPTVGGTKTLWYREDSIQAAQSVQEQLAQATGLNNQGIRRQYLVGFYYAKVPSIAVEVAYLSNPAEEKLLTEPSFQQRAADGIYHGIVAFFDWLDLFKLNMLTSTLP